MRIINEDYKPIKQDLLQMKLDQILNKHTKTKTVHNQYETYQSASTLFAKNAHFMLNKSPTMLDPLKISPNRTCSRIEQDVFQRALDRLN